MPERPFMVRSLLWVFAISLVVSTLLGLGLGFDLFVAPPQIAETLDLPSRLIALEPFRAARWPWEFLGTLAYVIGTGALFLAAGPVAALSGTDRRAGLVKSSLQVAGLVGVVSGLIFVGAMGVPIAEGYCDCGFKTEETISQFWAVNVINGATTWLDYGVLVFGAIGLVTAALALAGRGLPAVWRTISLTAAGLLIASILLRELSDSPAGDLVAALATGLLLPAWAIILAEWSERTGPGPMAA